MRSASRSDCTLPSTDVSVCSRPSAVCTAPDSVPKPPRITFVRLRFMPSHMIFVRMAPLQPMREPTTVSTGLLRRKPSATSAQPE